MTGLTLELFPCSGGLAEGLRRAGITIDMAFDFDSDACNSYERNLGHRPVQMDVRDLLRMVRGGWSPGQVDLLIADPPCTPWSRAGNRKGQADERDMLGVTVELIEMLRPRVWLIANVPGLDDANNWESVVKPVIGGMASMCGYCVDYAKLNCADFGVPQKRIRPFWFGHPIGTPCIEWPHHTHCKPPILPGCGLRPWVTCREALAHLPIEELGRPVKLRGKWAEGNGPNHKPTTLDKVARTITRNTHSDGCVLSTTSKHPCSIEDEPGMTVPASMPTNGGAVLITNHYCVDIDDTARTITTKQDDSRILRVSSKHPAHAIDELAKHYNSSHGGGSKRVLILNERHPINIGDGPSHAITAKGGSRGAQGGGVLEWPWDSPSTVICAGPQLSPPGRNGRTGENQRGSPNAVVLSEKAAAILQGFPDGWHFEGKTKRTRWAQIGMAMPPPMAEAVGLSIARWRAKVGGTINREATA